MTMSKTIRLKLVLGLNITPRSFVSDHVVWGEKCGLLLVGSLSWKRSGWNGLIMSTVELEGLAYLSFFDDGSWFQVKFFFIPVTFAIAKAIVALH